MDEKDDIIEKQIADAMINPTENAVGNLNKIATVIESRLDILESDVEELKDSIKKMEEMFEDAIREYR